MDSEGILAKIPQDSWQLSRHLKFTMNNQTETPQKQFFFLGNKAIVSSQFCPVQSFLTTIKNIKLLFKEGNQKLF